MTEKERQILVRLWDSPFMADCRGELQAMFEVGTKGNFEQESLGKPTLGAWQFYAFQGLPQDV